MPIKYIKEKRVFHLYNKDISYMIHISKDNGIAHLYFGKYLKDFDLKSLFVNTSCWLSYLDNDVEVSKDKELIRAFCEE